jgi:hypothetical protein
MTDRRVALLAVASVGVLVGASATAQAGPPAAAIRVPVTAGTTTAHVNAGVATGAIISGTITSPAGRPLRQAEVGLYTRTGRTVAFSLSDARGRYQFGGLAPTSTGYAICVDGRFVGGSPTGYLGRCYRTASWSGSGRSPATTTRVTVDPAQHRSGLNIVLTHGAAISGIVRSSSGRPLSGVTVLARNRGTEAKWTATTSGTGAYSITGLPAAARGYSVCFDGAQTATPSTGGFLSQCYRGRAWSGHWRPARARIVSVRLGHDHARINGALRPGGAIHGRITDARTGRDVRYASVEVFSRFGHLLGTTQAAANGQYAINGLPAAVGDRVCVTRTYVSAAATYAPRCYRTVERSGSGRPRGTSAVRVRAGHAHLGIGLRVARQLSALPASIAGTVTSGAGGPPLAYAEVDVFANSGARVASTSTDSTGNYQVAMLPASGPGYRVCVRPNGAQSSRPSATGWAPRCYQSTGWDGATVPAAATRVPLRAGQVRSGVDVALSVGGAISGTVTVAGSGAPAALSIEVRTSAGTTVGTGFSSSADGTYSVTGLAPSAAGYTVCFDGATFDGSAGYVSRCYQGVR